MGEYRRAEMTARIEAAPAEERGRIMVVMWCHAVASTAANGGLATSVALSAVRIWRHRDQRWLPAVRDGGYWRAVTGFAVASVGLRAAGVFITSRIAAGGDACPSDHRPGPR
jgi:hypothetical protein